MKIMRGRIAGGRILVENESMLRGSVRLKAPLIGQG